MESYLYHGTKLKGKKKKPVMDKDNGVLSSGHGYVWGGGNKPLPDFESKQEIISVKSRTTQSIQVNHTDVGKEEKLRHIEAGKPIDLRVYETRYLKVLRSYAVKALKTDEDK